jgi:hypothetical protein
VGARHAAWPAGRAAPGRVWRRRPSARATIDRMQRRGSSIGSIAPPGCAMKSSAAQAALRRPRDRRRDTLATSARPITTPSPRSESPPPATRQAQPPCVAEPPPEPLLALAPPPSSALPPVPPDVLLELLDALLELDADVVPPLPPAPPPAPAPPVPPPATRATRTAAARDQVEREDDLRACTRGSGRWVPSWPWPASPHARRVPSDESSIECHAPHATATAHSSTGREAVPRRGSRAVDAHHVSWDASMPIHSTARLAIAAHDQRMLNVGFSCLTRVPLPFLVASTASSRPIKLA